MADFVGKEVCFPWYRNGFRITSLIGEGGFAFVYQAVDLKTKQTICVKRMICGESSEARTTAEREISLFNLLKGTPHVVEFYGGGFTNSKDSTEAYITMELCSRGHLFGVLSTMQSIQKSFEVSSATDILIEIASSIQTLHQHKPPIAHRDIKLENILVDGNGRCKLCDFGSCVIGPVSLTTSSERANEKERVEKCSTLAYRAPEMCDLYSVSELTEAVDIWAFGCLIFTLLYMVHPFQEAGTLGILSAKWRSAIPHNQLSKKFFRFEELLERVFYKEVMVRADIEEVLACLHAIRKEEMLPNRPEIRIQALEKVNAMEKAQAEQRQRVLLKKKGVDAFDNKQVGLFSQQAKELDSNSSAAFRLRQRRKGTANKLHTHSQQAEQTNKNDSMKHLSSSSKASHASTGTKTSNAFDATFDAFPTPAPTVTKISNAFDATFDAFPTPAPTVTQTSNAFDASFDAFPTPAPTVTQTSNAFDASFDAFPTPAPTVTQTSNAFDATFDAFSTSVPTQAAIAFDATFDAFPTPAPTVTQTSNAFDASFDAFPSSAPTQASNAFDTTFDAFPTSAPTVTSGGASLWDSLPDATGALPASQHSSSTHIKPSSTKKLSQKIFKHIKRLPKNTRSALGNMMERVSEVRGSISHMTAEVSDNFSQATKSMHVGDIGEAISEVMGGGGGRFEGFNGGGGGYDDEF